METQHTPDSRSPKNQRSEVIFYPSPKKGLLQQQVLPCLILLIILIRNSLTSQMRIFRHTYANNVGRK